MKKNNKTLYSQIGLTFIQTALYDFYKKAFNDPIIGHFFFQKNHDELVQKQIEFTCTMLGSKQHKYTGKPLEKAHHHLSISKAHFNRRKILLRETLYEHGLADTLIENWLELEEKLQKLVIKKPSNRG